MGAQGFCSGVPNNAQLVPLAVFHIGGKGRYGNGAGKIECMIGITIGLDADVVITRIEEVGISPGVERNTDGWDNALESHTFSHRTHTGAHRLQHEHDAIGTGSIVATQEYIEPEIERLFQVDL